MDAAVEAVRIGYITANSPSAYSKWRNRPRRDGKAHGLTGEALERVIRGLAMTNPEYVVIEGA